MLLQFDSLHEMRHNWRMSKTILFRCSKLCTTVWQIPNTRMISNAYTVDSAVEKIPTPFIYIDYTPNFTNVLKVSTPIFRPAGFWNLRTVRLWKSKMWVRNWKVQEMKLRSINWDTTNTTRDEIEIPQIHDHRLDLKEHTDPLLHTSRHQMVGWGRQYKKKY